MESRKRAAMASRDEGGSQIVPVCASFFEVADLSTEASHEEPSLALPKAFIKRFHTYLSHAIILEAPGGEMWEARLEADTQKQLRITAGWKDFADYLSVQSGDLLVLDLVSKAHFRVHIYEGEDLCEKDLYSLRNRKSCAKDMHAPEFIANVNKHKGDTCKVHTNSKFGYGIDTHLGNGNTPLSLRKLEPEGTQFTPTCKAPASNICSAMNVNGPQQIVPYNSSSRVKNSTKTCFTLSDLHKVCTNFHAKTRNAFKMALSYSSIAPFTVLVMIHSNVCHGFKVAIPKSFAKQHLGADVEHVALIDTENKAWSVTWLGHNNPNLSFSGGWKHFAVDHHLKCGDICIFEKASTKALSTFKVYIFKVNIVDGPEIQQTIPSKLSNVIARGFT